MVEERRIGELAAHLELPVRAAAPLDAVARVVGARLEVDLDPSLTSDAEGRARRRTQRAGPLEPGQDSHDAARPFCQELHPGGPPTIGEHAVPRRLDELRCSGRGRAVEVPLDQELHLVLRRADLAAHARRRADRAEHATGVEVEALARCEGDELDEKAGRDRRLLGGCWRGERAQRESAEGEALDHAPPTARAGGFNGQRAQRCAP
jgi:hypothetical protein